MGRLKLIFVIFVYEDDDFINILGLNVYQIGCWKISFSQQKKTPYRLFLEDMYSNQLTNPPIR